MAVMKVVIAGGTGFIGRALCASLNSDGHEVLVLTRRPRPERPWRQVAWDPSAGGEWQSALEGAGAVVNLCGESVVDGRWTSRRQALLAASRITPTRHLAEALVRGRRRETVLVSASAVGFYGDQGDAELTESSPQGAGFLANLCAGWEGAALGAESAGVRSVALRIGIVLAREGGALAKMLPPFTLGLGGPLGSGRQWMSWISRPDLVRLIRYCIEGSLSGPVNATAPHPVPNEEFSRALAGALGRPCWARVPAAVLRLALGEMAGMLLDGQRVLPRKALEAGFRFSAPDLKSALAEALA